MTADAAGDFVSHLKSSVNCFFRKCLHCSMAPLSQELSCCCDGVLRLTSGETDDGLKAIEVDLHDFSQEHSGLKVF